MKQLIIYSVLLGCCLFAQAATAQQNTYWQEPTRVQADSLEDELKSEENDSVRMYLNRQLGIYYQEINRFVALGHYKEQLRIAKKLKQPLWEAEALSRFGYVSSLMQNYIVAFNVTSLAREIVSDPESEENLWRAQSFSKDGNPRRARLAVLVDVILHQGILNYFTGDFSRALKYYDELNVLSETLHDNALNTMLWLNRGESYLGLMQLDSAKTALNKALHYCNLSGYEKYKGLMYYDMGKILELEGSFGDAKKMYLLSVQSSLEQESTDFVGMGYQALADITRSKGAVDSSFMYSRKAVNLYLEMNDTLGLASAYKALSSAFDASSKNDSALYYLKKSLALETSLNKAGKAKKFQLISYNEQLKLQSLEAEQLRTQTQTRTWVMISGIGVLLLVTGILYRSSRRQKKDKAKIEASFHALKATQSQLIQSEKMASLGELTAGIAHEIQNPLNFVNNFSEVSTELVDEMNAELAKGDMEEAKAISNDLKQNLEKINHHGKRADAIVKGMLQHSRASSGQKEPTDINALADEYLRLAYHGLRAKDKSFNATLKTEYDLTVGYLNVVPQDIGRVILNLITNAFYAVNERLRYSEKFSTQPDSGYEPTVTVTTKRNSSYIIISVKDNGSGIPQKALDKIFQPFFTTKPTGQGTGLGLSLAYDIVKAHGGELKVETDVGDSRQIGATFIISLPIE